MKCVRNLRDMSSATVSVLSDAPTLFHLSILCCPDVYFDIIACRYDLRYANTINISDLSVSLYSPTPMGYAPLHFHLPLYYMFGTAACHVYLPTQNLKF